METAALKLTADNFPLPCSVRDLVGERFGGVGSTDAPLMARQELIGYLREMDERALSPLDVVLARTEAIGDPELPSAGDLAILGWMGETFRYWEQQFPLAEPLAGELRRLKPLLAAVAVSDPAFLVPGAHPVHRLMDCIQQAAVGWQPELGRAAQPMLQLVGDLARRLLEWFDAENFDLAGVCEQGIERIERDTERALRMGQRAEDAERGHLRQLQANRQAAAMINDALEGRRLPAIIGSFLKGPWYDSAQLVLLKYGADSSQWQTMCDVTSALLDSLQDGAESSEVERQRLFDMVTRLPKELRRWLLSVQHDAQALGSALGAIEAAHMRILRRQPMEPVAIEPLACSTPAPVHRALQEILSGLEVGRWYLVDTGTGKPLRARLALRLEDDRSLLFTNCCGARALRPGFADFSALLAEGRVRPLDCGCAFSRSLAWAAGIESFEELEELTGAMAGIARQEAELRRQEAEEAERQKRLAEEARRRDREGDRLGLGAGDNRGAPPADSDHDPGDTGGEEDAQTREWQRLRDRQLAREKASMGEAEPAASEQSGNAPPAAMVAAAATEAAALQCLSMGAWLGFHDGEAPLLARLAVHDRQADTYTFVNRNGIKLRELRGEELLALVQRGEAEILETRDTFREAVSRLRGNRDEQPGDGGEAGE